MGENRVPDRYKWVETSDGSLTLYSESFQENCHSLSGARAETLFHYIEGCHVVELYGKLDHFTLLEVGLGTGMGLILTLETLQKLTAKKTNLISTEIDKTLVEFLIANPPHEFFNHLKFENDYYHAHYQGLEIYILVGDARKTVPKFFKEKNLKVDVIYQDAFSPRKNPDLWTVEWFKDLKQISNNHARMSTYSASSSIRKSMIEAEWILQRGLVFGTKRDSTRAGLIGTTEAEILERLSRSPVSALTDANCADYKEGNSKHVTP